MSLRVRSTRKLIKFGLLPARAEQLGALISEKERRFIMKHFIVEITYTVPFEALTEVVPVHRAFLQEGYDKGWLLMSGPLNPKTGGIVVGRAPSVDDLRDFFRKDPYSIKGLATYKFVEFEPVKRQAFLEEWVS
jgi:uncharacterized protein YciI